MKPSNSYQRQRNYTLNRYRAIVGYIGSVLVIIGATFFVPLLVLPFYPEELPHAVPFILTGLGLAAIGAVLWRRLVPREEPQSFSPTVQESMMMMVICWLVAIVAGMIPFAIITDMSFTLSVFESTSGWTGTGLTVVDPPSTPRIILLYRSFAQVVGGAGFAIIALSAVTAPAGIGLSVAEGRTEQLAPHVRRSAEIVLTMYAVYLAVGVLALILAGMTPFDAVNHAFTGVATGGFSTRAESVGYWDSPAVELVLVVLMILGATNFLTAWLLIRRNYGAVIHNGEIRLSVVVMPLSIMLMLLVVTSGLFAAGGKAVRVAIFETTSAMTTTGFNTVDHNILGGFGLLLLTVLMVVGGGSGSTAAGLKQFRVYALYKGLKWEIRRMFMPRHSVNEPVIWHGGQRSFLSDSDIRHTALFVFIYMTGLIVCAGIMTAHGYTVGDSLYESASTLSAAGLSVGITGPDAPTAVLWTQIVGMFLGRLEFFAVIVGVSRLALDLRVMRPRFKRPNGNGQSPTPPQGRIPVELLRTVERPPAPLQSPTRDANQQS